jgi:2-amino-4-hydroxy-6-hydroxymethyldihydropteridine diphosphokinase
MICYIALGSNLGDRLYHLRRAVRSLQATDGVRVVRCSPVYETKPEGGLPRQRDYLNGVVRIRTQKTPDELLIVLKGIEKKFGRRVSKKRGLPRPIDLDIIFFGKRVLRDQALILPHPRFRRRVFVLRPLADIAPRWRDPVTGKTAVDLLRRLKDPGYWRKLDEAIVP